MDTVNNKIEPMIYVGTYGKYNEGSIKGKWLKLNDYEDINAFYKAALKLHNDEYDPELMFQDWENIPGSMICEGDLNVNIYDFIDAVNNSHIDYEVFLSAIESGIDWDSVEESYRGEAQSDEDFALEFAEETGFCQPSEWPFYAIDWKAAARDLMYDYTEVDGHYFYNS
jgi:antirestriction protein